MNKSYMNTSSFSMPLHLVSQTQHFFLSDTNKYIYIIYSYNHRHHIASAKWYLYLKYYVVRLDGYKIADVCSTMTSILIMIFDQINWMILTKIPLLQCETETNPLRKVLRKGYLILFGLMFIVFSCWSTVISMCWLFSNFWIHSNTLSKTIYRFLISLPRDV